MPYNEYENESEYKGSDFYVIDDPDLIDSDVESVRGRPLSPPSTPPPTALLKPRVSGDVAEDKRRDVFDTKGLIHYNFNVWGWPFSLAAVGYYGWVLFDQMKVQLPTIYDDMMPINLAFKLRYIGVLAYFLTCIIRRSYIFECRNAEAPLIVSSVLEFYYLLSYNERDEDPPMAYELLLPLGLTVLCFLRRRPYFKWAINPWTKDKPNLAEIIESLGMGTDGISADL